MTINKFKNIIILAVVMIASINAFAVPAKRVWRTVTLTDGTKIEAMLVGDEHGHWLIDRNGKALDRNEDGTAYYMTDTQFTDRKQQRNKRAKACNATRVKRIESTRALSKNASSSASRQRKTFGEPTHMSGSKKGLVILVNFSDKSFLSSNNQNRFNRMFNEVGYNENGCIGSVHDYFYDQSYGKFDLDFDVVGPVTLSKSHDYYGANNSNGDDKYAGKMIIEALNLVDSEVNFKDYDWDGNGEVEQVFVIYAGTGEATSDKASDIWPHEYTLTEAKVSGDGTGPQYLDGVKIDTYACSNELSSSTQIDGIGTACHEFSHCLGYADLYDTDYSGGQGMMYWDLLDAGSYNGPNDNGEVPAAYTSFERWWAGWLDLTTLTKPVNIKDMPALNDEPVAYKIVNDGYPNEYYLLENRQAKRWDSYTAGDNDGTGHGMLILHVDYNKSIWVDNAPNDVPSRQRMTYFPADNNYGTKSYQSGDYYWSATFDQLAGDPFPGSKNKTSFTDDTTPAATLYNYNTDGTKKMGKPITNISESNGLISFTFMGGKASPSVTNIDVNDPSSFTATWSSVDDAKEYSVRAMPFVKKSISESLILNEGFSKASGNTYTDFSDDLDDYTDNKGWTGYKVYFSTTKGEVKIGSSSANGLLTSPIVESTTGNLTIQIKAKKYNKDNSSIQTWLCDAGGTQIKAIDDYTLSSDYSTKIITCAANEKNTIKFLFTKRGYVDEIKIYDGELTAEDINSISSGSKALVPVQTISGDTITVSGLTDTYYTFTGLTADKYRFQVKAIYSDNSESDWTTPTTVALDVTSIVDIQDFDKPKDQRIFSINGQMMGTNPNALAKGIYIIGGKKYVKR